MSYKILPKCGGRNATHKMEETLPIYKELNNVPITYNDSQLFFKKKKEKSSKINFEYSQYSGISMIKYSLLFLLEEEE